MSGAFKEQKKMILCGRKAGKCYTSLVELEISLPLRWGFLTCELSCCLYKILRCSCVMVQHQIIRESGGRKVFSIRDEELLFPKVYGKA